MVSLVTVLIIAIVLILLKRGLYFWQYLTLFFLLSGFGFWAQADATIYRNPCRLSSAWEIRMISEDIGPRELTATERGKYKRLADLHKLDGDRSLHFAENICLYLPEKSDRERAADCFRVAMVAMIPADPVTKAIAMLITLLTQHGIDCLDAWRDIDEHLGWAQYHYEMYEFYASLAGMEKY